MVDLQHRMARRCIAALLGGLALTAVACGGSAADSVTAPTPTAPSDPIAASASDWNDLGAQLVSFSMAGLERALVGGGYVSAADGAASVHWRPLLFCVTLLSCVPEHFELHEVYPCSGGSGFVTVDASIDSTASGSHGVIITRYTLCGPLSTIKTIIGGESTATMTADVSLANRRLQGNQSAHYQGNLEANIHGQARNINADLAISFPTLGGNRSITGSLDGNAVNANVPREMPQLPAPTTLLGVRLLGNPTLSAGEAEQLVAEAVYADYSTRTISGEAVWSSSNPSVASVSATGVVTAIAAGAATVMVQYQGFKGTTQVSVGSAPLSAHYDLISVGGAVLGTPFVVGCGAPDTRLFDGTGSINSGSLDLNPAKQFLLRYSFTFKCGEAAPITNNQGTFGTWTVAPGENPDSVELHPDPAAPSILYQTRVRPDGSLELDIGIATNRGPLIKTFLFRKRRDRDVAVSMRLAPPDIGRNR